MKNILKILLERDYGISSLNININKLLEFSDEQLLVLLNNGVNISEDLVLNYAPGIGLDAGIIMFILKVNSLLLVLLNEN